MKALILITALFSASMAWGQAETAPGQDANGWYEKSDLPPKEVTEILKAVVQKYALFNRAGKYVPNSLVGSPKAKPELIIKINALLQKRKLPLIEFSPDLKIQEFAEADSADTPPTGIQFNDGKRNFCFPCKLADGNTVVGVTTGEPTAEQSPAVAVSTPPSEVATVPASVRASGVK